MVRILEACRVPLIFLTKKENKMKYKIEKIKRVFLGSLIFASLGCNTKKELIAVPKVESAPPSTTRQVPAPATSNAGVKFQLNEPNVPNQY